MSGCAGSDPADAQGVRPRKVQLQPEAPSPGYILSHEPQALADQCRLSLDKWVSFAYVLALVRITLAHVLPSRAYTPVGRLITHTCRLTGAVYAVAMGCPPPSWHARWYFGSFAPFLDLVQFFTDPDPVGWLEAVNGAVHLLCLGVMSHVYYQRGDQLGVGRFSMVARQALVTAVCLGMAPWGRRRRRGGVALTAPLRWGVRQRNERASSSVAATSAGRAGEGEASGSDPEAEKEYPAVSVRIRLVAKRCVTGADDRGAT